MAQVDPVELETVAFGPIAVSFDGRVLRPRPVDPAPGPWAAELSSALGPGPILEVCAGAGHIGQAAVLAGRALVEVDVDPHACALAEANAAANVASRVGRRVRSRPTTRGPRPPGLE